MKLNHSGVKEIDRAKNFREWQVNDPRVVWTMGWRKVSFEKSPRRWCSETGCPENSRWYTYSNLISHDFCIKDYYRFDYVVIMEIKSSLENLILIFKNVIVFEMSRSTQKTAVHFHVAKKLIVTIFSLEVTCRRNFDFVKFELLNLCLTFLFVFDRTNVYLFRIFYIYTCICIMCPLMIFLSDRLQVILKMIF